MTEFSKPQSFDFGAAVLQGFNLPGGKNYLFRVAAWAAILMTVIYVLLGAPVVTAYVDFFRSAIEAEYNLDGPDTAAVLEMMAPMFRAMGFMALIGLLQIAVFASAETAIYRNLFHQEDRGVFPLTFGMDELRVMGTRIVVGFILGGVYIGAYILLIIIGALIFGFAGAGAGGGMAAIGGILIFLIIIFAIIAFAWIAIRLAPSAAFSVKHRVFNPVASWTPMRGFVWPAIGGYLILYLAGYFILSFVVGIIFLLLFFSSGIIGALTQIDATSDVTPDFSPVLEHVSSAGFIIPLVLAILISMFLSLIWYGMMWSMWAYFAKDREAEYWDPKTKNEAELWQPN